MTLPAARPPAPEPGWTTEQIVAHLRSLGSALGVALSAHGLSSVIVDIAKRDTILAAGFDGRASAIASAPYRMLQAIGVIDRLAGVGCPIEGIRVSDGLAPGSLDFAPDQHGDALGTMFENRHLRRALIEAAEAAEHVDLRMETRATHVDRTAFGVTATLSDGTTVHAPLLIARILQSGGPPTRDILGDLASHTLPIERLNPEGQIAILLHDDSCGRDTLIPLEDAGFRRVAAYHRDPHKSELLRAVYPYEWTFTHAPEDALRDADAVVIAALNNITDHLEHWLAPLPAAFSGSLIVSCGEADFAALTCRVMGYAETYCGGRLVSVLEGGYDLGALGRSAAAHVGALMGRGGGG